MNKNFQNNSAVVDNKPVTSGRSSRASDSFMRISNYINEAKRNVLHSINIVMIKAYWVIGYEIVQYEQGGQSRAAYGDSLIKELSEKLTNEFGKGYSVSNLRYMRQFYLTFQNPIHRTVSGELTPLLGTPEESTFIPKLSWSKYCLLMQVRSDAARAFYEQEAIKNNWSVRELDRQIGSLLYERVAGSKDKEELLKLSAQGQDIERPEDAIKDPVILEFLNIPEAHQNVESKLEDALITNLQHFLLEMGRGFSFVARQKRITLDGRNFYVDLVFYHTILKCYIVIDLKTQQLTHGDLGQIQFYVNYFDQEIKMDDDNPTVGLVLCTSKSDEMVKYTLGEKAKQIFASRYQFHLPSVEDLEKEIRREVEEIKYRLGKDYE